jgi:hypothetical protein
MGLSVIDPRMFDVSGDIHQITLADDGTGTDVETAEIIYPGVRSKYMNPLKTDTLETFEFNQQTAKLKASWLIRNERSRTITANKMIYVVDGEHHSITGVRNFKGNRNLLVLDTIQRDNATIVEVVEAPTDLVLTANYTWINLTWSDNTSGEADSYNIYRKVDTGELTLLTNTTNLTSYDDFLVGDDVKYLEYEVEAVIGARVTTRANTVSYLTGALNPDLFLDARDLDYLTLNGLGAQVIGDQSATGADFTQVVVANQGQVDSATVPTQISYDGVSDYSENTLDVAKFAAYDRGSVVYIANIGSSTRYFFTMSDLSVATNFVRFGVTSLNEAILFVRKSGGNSNSMKSTTILSEGDIIEWRSNGSTYTCFINGVEDLAVVNSGVNDGRWFDYPNTLDQMSISAFILTSGSSFYESDFKHLSIFSTPLTDAESADYANYLNKKHE